MGFKGRVKFVVAGTHPLLLLARDRLIHTGYALVPWTERPDFCLFGGVLPQDAEPAAAFAALAQQAQVIYGADIPVLLLSQDIGLHMPPIFAGTGAQVYTSMAEYLFVQNTRTLVLRVFNVYGRDIKWGVVDTFIKKAARGEALPVYNSGYQTRTFLYQDDFLVCLDLCVQRFVDPSNPNCAGIYDVGHPDEHSIKRLADSVWQLTHGSDVVTLTEKISAPWDIVGAKTPDCTHLQSLVQWKPKISLRQGLWLLTAK